MLEIDADNLDELIEMLIRHCAGDDEAKRRLIIGAMGMAYVNGLLTARGQMLEARLPQDEMVN